MASVPRAADAGDVVVRVPLDYLSTIVQAAATAQIARANAPVELVALRVERVALALRGQFVAGALAALPETTVAVEGVAPAADVGDLPADAPSDAGNAVVVAVRAAYLTRLVANLARDRLPLAVAEASGDTAAWFEVRVAGLPVRCRLVLRTAD